MIFIKKAAILIATILIFSNVVLSKSQLDDVPVNHDQMPDKVDLKFSREWRAPNYGSQEGALGYSAESFTVPKGMEKQVQFWIDIYSKYTTLQGVIHDTEEVEKVYEVVDFKDIEDDESLDPFKKERLKRKRVNELKKKVAEREGIKKHDMDRIRFQLGQKDRMLEAIYFSGRYIEEMEQIFKDNGLPLELTRLPFVESSFNIMARSKVGASGIWQIMRYTARPYRMINDAVDKRNHPIESTKLAAKILKINYNMLDSWPLALTGYNHGPSGVKKLTQKYKTVDISELVEVNDKKKSFGFASRNFYSSFLAALEVEKNAKQYFPKVLWSAKLNSKPLQLPRDIYFKELLVWFDGDAEKAKIFNPHLTTAAVKGKVIIPKKSIVEVPSERLEIAKNFLEKVRRNKVASKSVDIDLSLDTELNTNSNSNLDLDFDLD